MSALAERVDADRRIIRPQPGPQEAFLASSADIAIAGGAAGVGKTWALLMEPLRHVQNSDFGAVFFRRESPQITNIGGLWDESEKLYPSMGGRPRRNVLEWEFPSGSRVKMSHLQYEADRNAWAGAQVPLLNFDQLEQFTEGQFWFMVSRNRSMSGVRPYIRATCNPVPDDDPTGGWLHRLISWWLDEETGYPRWERSGVIRWFVRLDEAMHWADSKEELLDRFRHRAGDDVQPKSLTFIPGKLEHNQKLMAADPGYRANLLALPLVERERLLGGNWTIKPAAGKVFNRAWFEIVPAAPIEPNVRRIRAWDLAASDGKGDWSVGVRMFRASNGLFYIDSIIRGQWRPMERDHVINQTAELDNQNGQHTEIWIEEEGGSSGKSQSASLARMLAGYSVHSKRSTGSKVVRTEGLSAQAEARNVKLVSGDWVEPFLAELHGFPDGAHDDMVDASSLAFNELTSAAPVNTKVLRMGRGRTTPRDF